VHDPLPTVPIQDAMVEVLGVDLLHVSHDVALIDRERGIHPLLQAVHVAFAEHRPLILSPDHVWLTIAQGFALHVQQSAEELRRRFVRHDGRAELRVTVDELPATSAEWAAVIGELGRGIAEHVGPGVHRLLSCAFSTTTERERVASEVVMMSAFRRYFDFILNCVCGIPEITLEGSAEDWAEIRRRLDVLAEYDLAWWAAALRPVLDALANTARGEVDRDFWQCIYKPAEAYGGDVVTGWIMRLFPYLERDGGGVMRNPAVLQAPEEAGRARWIGPGITADSAPAGTSRATLNVTANEESSRLSVFGGFAGVRQQDDGALRPEIAWAVGASPRMATLIDRILAEHEARSPAEHQARRRGPDLPADLLELYDRCDGGVLFGRWNLARRAEIHEVVGSVDTGFLGITPHTPWEHCRPTEDIPVIPICTLEGDPRYFGLYQGDEFVVVLCDPRRAEAPEEIVVVADDMATFLERILEHRGATWFEDLREPTLYSRLSRYHHCLRRALTPGPHAAPTDLDGRETYQLVTLLTQHRGSEAHRAFWWEALRGATGTNKSREELFGRERRPMGDVLKDLGLR
jgi:hypothetical protein